MDSAGVHEEHQGLAGEGVGQVEGMKLGPDLGEIKFVRGHDQELVDQLVKNLDGRGAILKQEKWH